LIEENDPTVAQLRRIGDELGFGSLQEDERNTLRDVFLDLSNRYGNSGARRQRSLLFVLLAAHQSPEGIDDPNWQLLHAALQHRLPAMTPFECPPPLAKQLAQWRIYALHEYLAFSLEVVLAVAVEEVGRSETTASRAISSVMELSERVRALLQRPFAKRNLGDLQRDSVASLRLPALDPDSDAYDEARLRQAAWDTLAGGNHQEALTASLKLVARVSARVTPGVDAYGPFTQDSMSVDSTRLSLNDLSRYIRDNRSQEMGQVTSDLVRLVVNTHLRVATAKLAFNNDFTYKLVFETGILRKVREVEPAFSHPRLQQGAQILADLNLLDHEAGRFHITQDGINVLRGLGCCRG
jgi:hypothetical protein